MAPPCRDAIGSTVAAVDEFVIAKNPDPDSTLPFLVRLPLSSGPVVLKVKDTWPRTAKIYCHPSNDWPSEPQIVERVATRSCVRRGAAIDLVLDRGRENRSQFIFTKARGRDMVFWQSARTSKKARPNVSVPTARASGRQLEIVVDSYEQYAWNFKPQQATTTKRALAAGDYGIEADGVVVAAVERKSLDDLVATITSGKLGFLLAELATVGRSALVVEERYSSIFKLKFVRPVVVAEGLAEAAVRYPETPVLFCETRQLAQEWTYRFLGAALEHHEIGRAASQKVAVLPAGGPVPAAEVTTRMVRAWARQVGMQVPNGGKLRPEIWQAYQLAHPETS